MFNRKALRRNRIENDMTQGELGRLVGCLGNDISRYERGDKVPREGRIRKLAKAMNIPESSLYTNPPVQSDAIRAKIETILDQMSEADKAEVLSIMLRMIENKPQKN